MHNIVKYARVKRDYLIRLAFDWYRLDTKTLLIDAFARAARAQSVRSSEKSDSIGSRARTSSARPPSTSTSQGRGRVL